MSIHRDILGPTMLAGSLLRCGAFVDPIPPVPLRAGPLTLRFEEDSLRYIRLGSHEIVRRIYCAVRDRDWGTIPNHIEGLEQQIHEDSFSIQFDVSNVQGEIDFRWHARIEGGADGVITFEMDGQAQRSFFKNRMGFCVLHPITGCAGRKCHVVTEDGTRLDSEFPRFVAANNPFKDIRSIRHSVADGVWAELAFEGDLFEMEDQRNWTDASFKTFCTPLRLPFPAEVKEGERVFQRVTLRITHESPAVPFHAEPSAKRGRGFASSPHPVPPVTLTFDDEKTGNLPSIGLGWTPHDQPWTDLEVERLRRLSLSHLRVELRLNAHSYASELSQAVADAGRLDVPLEAVLIVSDNAAAELGALVDPMRHSRPRIVRWSVFHNRHWSTPRQIIQTARSHLSAYDPSVPIGAGTMANFKELNAHRPPVDLLDFATYSIHPQEHAFDDTSLTETLAAQGETVRSAREFLGECPIVVSPVTLKKRVNPYSTTPPTESGLGQLPITVDRRQMSLFGAGWTLGSLKYLAENQVAAVTYFETIGWLGVMERASGAPLPQEFPSIPGAVFPLYFVLANCGAMKEAAVVTVQSSDPLRIDAMALRHEDKMRIMIANLSGRPQRVVFDTDRTRSSVRVLDEQNAAAATQSPETFMQSHVDRSITGTMELSLAPYAYTCLDLR